MKSKIILFFTLAVIAASVSSCFFHGHEPHHYQHNHPMGHRESGHHDDR